MKLKGIRMEDFTNYKKPSMFLAFPSCTWKCERECGEHCCQNSALAQSPDIDVPIEALIERYRSNNITSAVVMGGLEPMDTWKDVICFVERLRDVCDDDVVIYSGYTEEEIEYKLDCLRNYKNIIVKFGRFVPNQDPHYDEVLGVTLASANQYARRIS